MDPYASAGVDEEREQDVFATAMRPWLARTAVRSPLVTSITGLASGYFATLMHIPPGPPIALTTDGVGTKILLAREADRWEPVGIDCVANNVNDVICTGAVPLALLDYIATDRIDAAVLEAIARGLYRGADEASIAIPAGEIAQIGAARWTGPRSGWATSSWPCPVRACTATAIRWPAGPSAGAPASWPTRCSRRPGCTCGPPRRCGGPGSPRAAWRTSPAAACSTWPGWPRTCRTPWTRCRPRRRSSDLSPRPGTSRRRPCTPPSTWAPASASSSPRPTPRPRSIPWPPRGSSPSWPARSPPAPAATCPSRRRACWAAATAFPRFDCGFGCYNPRNRSQRLHGTV